MSDVQQAGSKNVAILRRKAAKQSVKNTIPEIDQLGRTIVAAMNTLDEAHHTLVNRLDRIARDLERFVE